MKKTGSNISKRALALLLAGVIVFLTACGQKKPEGGDSPAIVSPSGEQETGAEQSGDGLFSLNADFGDSFNPYTSKTAENRLVCQLPYENLFELDDNYNLSSRIVLSSETANGGSTWTFNLDTSILMHDGEPLTAQDVSYSISVAFSSNRFGGRFLNYAGAFASGDSVVISLSKPNNLLPYLLTIPIIKRDSFKESMPAGCGPYKFSEDGTYLEAFPDYAEYDKLPVDTIYLKEYKDIEELITAFEDRIIDLVTNDRTSKNNLGYGGNTEIRHYTTTNLHFFGFNMQSEKSDFVKSEAYRYAMQYALDREMAAKTFMNGNAIPTVFPVSPKSPLYNSELASTVSFDMERCKLVFDNAGVKDYDDDGKLEFPITGIPIEIDVDLIVCAENAGKGDIAKHFAANLSSIGIKVTVRELSWNDYMTALTDGDFDMYYGEVKIPADFNISSMVIEDGSLNYGKYQNEELIAYIDEYLAAGEDTRKEKCYNMLYNMLLKSPIIPICFERREVVLHRNVVTGINPSSSNIFLGITNWTIR